MKKADRIGGFIWLILGIALCLSSVKLKIGGLYNPGAGFMPFLAGVLLSIFGFVLLLLRSSQASHMGVVIEREGTFVPKDRSFFTPCFTLLLLFIFVMLLEPLGFLLATFLFLFSLFKFVERKKWLMPLFLSFISVILSHLVFSVWLRCQFPRGIFGF